PLLPARRPDRQCIGRPPLLGPPRGITWYVSLQGKATQRLSRSLSGQVAFTWQKELVLGTGTDTSYQVPGNVIINDVFDYKQNKQISPFSRPLMLVVAFNYTTPGFKSGDGAALKVLSSVIGDWTIGSVLRCQSGEVLRAPAATDDPLRRSRRERETNPALG